MRSGTYATLLSTVAALGGLLFGYDTAVVAGAIGFLRDHFALDAAGVCNRIGSPARPATLA